MAPRDGRTKQPNQRKGVLGSLFGRRQQAASASREVAAVGQGVSCCSPRTCQPSAGVTRLVETIECSSPESKRGWSPESKRDKFREGADVLPMLDIDPLRSLQVATARSSGRGATGSRKSDAWKTAPNGNLSGRTQETVDDSTRISSEGAIESCRHTRFTIEGFPGEKHAVFIPDSLSLQPGWLEGLCEVLGERPPTAAVCGVGSLAHPAALATPQLRACAEFEGLVAEGRNALGLPPADADSERGLCCDLLGDCRRPESSGQSSWRPPPKLSPEEQRKSAMVDSFVDRVLERRAEACCASVAQAASATDAWVLAFPALTTFEVLLQNAAERSDEGLGVYKAVAAHMQDAAYMENPQSRELMRQLFDASVSMGHGLLPHEASLTLSGDLWNPQRNCGHPEFKDHGLRHWSFQSAASSAARGHPLVEWPWPCADLFLLFYREAPGSGTGGGDRGIGADWQFKTRQRLDRSAVPLQPDMVAPPAYVFVGGDAHSKKKMLHLMQVARPTVFMDNTPGISKQAGLLLGVLGRALRQDAAGCRHLLHDGAWRQLPARPSSAQLAQALAPGKVLNYIEEQFNCSSLIPDERLCLSDIVQALDMVKLRPAVFRDTLCVVDPLQGSPEAAAQAAASVLCSPHVGPDAFGTGREFGGMAMRGWWVHRRLFQVEARMWRRAATAEVAVAALLLLLAALAAWGAQLLLHEAAEKESDLMGQLSGEGYPYGEQNGGARSAIQAMRLPLMLLPMVTGLAMILKSQLRLHHKWSRVHYATALVAYEIFHFLGSMSGYSGDVDDDRQLFLTRLEDIMRDVRELCHIETDSAAVAQAGSGDGWGPEEFQRHVEEAMYGLSPQGWLWRALGRICGCLGPLLEDPERDHCNEHFRDFSSPLSAQTYAEVRIGTLTKFYAARARAIRCARLALQIVIFGLLAAGSGLVMVKMSCWMPSCLTWALCALVVLQRLFPSDHASAIDVALAQLGQLDTKWQSAGIQERRSPAMKRRLVLAGERVALALAAAHGQVPLILPESLEIQQRPIVASGGEAAPRDRLAKSLRSARSNASGARSGSSTPMLVGRLPSRGW